MSTQASPVDIYRDAFVVPGRHELDTATVVREAPGASDVAWSRMLVHDDSGYDRLVEEVEAARPGVVFVLEHAARCADFVRQRPGWNASEPQLAMVLRDVQAVPDTALPEGLELRQDVALEDAAAVAVASDLTITEPAEGVVRFLAGLPPSVQLLAAVDGSGAAHATSACHVFGECTQIFFVNTEPDWRRRGVGRAMTAEAVRAAGRAGARRAILHATDFGVRVYEQLGFEPAGLLTRYWRVG